MDKKICGKCKEYKDLSDFHKKNSKSNKLSSRCKKCAIVYSRAFYKNNTAHYLKAAKLRWDNRKKNGLCVRCGLYKCFDDGIYCKSCNDKFLKNRKENRVKRKVLIFNHYGSTCTCCGEQEKRFLTIDHTNNDGSSHRKVIKRANIDKWIIKNNFPKDFQILCWNCNLGKYHNGGICPHKV